MTRLFTTLLTFFSLTAFAQYPANVESVLKISGKNRGELEKAILYFLKDPDTLKLKATYFLISNMDIHHSIIYYWADSLNHPVALMKGFEEIKPGMNPIQIKYKDIDSIKADFLIDNINRSFKDWKGIWANHLNFQEFCELILPYRVLSEPLQSWRATYAKNFSWVADSAKNKRIIDACLYVNSALNARFKTFNIEQKKEPLALQGALQLLFQKQVQYEDLSNLKVFALRSQGIPCAVDFVTSSNSHFIDISINENSYPIPFSSIADHNEKNVNKREPGKIVRFTYAKQPNSLSSQIPANEIPVGFMQRPNYVDVTSEYCSVENIVCPLFEKLNSPKIVYACVFNSSDWKAVWWGYKLNNTVEFNAMSKGLIYLPMYYVNNKLIPAGYPIVLTSKGIEHQIIPDTTNLQTITMKEQDISKFDVYGKEYRLFFWDNAWKLIQEKKADEKRLVIFEKAPRNALFLILSENCQGNERPFTIDANNEKNWW